MIRENELKVVGRLLKPHGICGEITALLTVDVDLSELGCIMLKLDGIFVPFFLSSVRPKSAETDLLTIDGITDELQAARLCPNDIYALAEELPGLDEDGFYAADMEGFEVVADGNPLGKIIGIDDTTANYLFIIETPSGNRHLIPVADEFVTGVDMDRRRVTMELPEGILGL